MLISVKGDTKLPVWYCKADPSGDFRTRLYTHAMAEDPKVWDNGTQLVNMRSYELRSYYDGYLHIDFLFDPCCARGSALYAWFSQVKVRLTSFTMLDKHPPMIQAYQAIKKHIRNCPECRAVVEVRRVGGCNGSKA